MTSKYDNMTPKQQEKFKKQNYRLWYYHFVTKKDPAKMEKRRKISNDYHLRKKDDPTYLKNRRKKQAARRANPVESPKIKRCSKQTMVNKRTMVQIYKESVGCECCGGKFPFFALHLDHLVPALKTKTYNKSAIDYKSSIKRIMQEIRKCQVLCATCHAIKTYESGDHLNKTSKLAKHNVGMVASVSRYEAELKELLAEKGIKRIRKPKGLL